MTFKVNGVEVGVYSTAETHSEWYNYTTRTHQAKGLDTAGFAPDSGRSTDTTFIGAHENTNNGSYAIVAHHYKNPNDTNQTQARLIFSGLAGLAGIENAFLQAAGQPVKTGAHGTHNFVFSQGIEVPDDADSDFVFEAGTPIEYVNPEVVVEDDPESFGDSQGDDSYRIDADDYVSNHLYSRNRGDGVMWVLGAGNYSFDINMGDIDDGRENTFPNPDEWLGRGPSGDSGPYSAGAGTSVTVSVDL